MTEQHHARSLRPSQPSRRRRETRKRLVDVAFDVFAEYGIADAPIEVICERAGFTRGAFYSNFTSKEDLFLALYQEEFASRLTRLRGGVDDLLAAPAAPAITDAVTRIIGLFTVHVATDTTWYRLTSEFELHSLRRPEIREQIATARQEFQDGVEQILLPLYARVGLRLLVPIGDVLLAFEAIYEAGLRRTLLLDAPVGAGVDTVTPLLSRVITSLVEPSVAGSAP